MTVAKRISKGRDGSKHTTRASSHHVARGSRRATLNANTHVIAGTVEPSQTEKEFIRAQGRKLTTAKAKQYK